MTFPLNFKGQQMDYDDLSSTSDRSCCICLSVRSMKMILALSDAYHWRTRYWSPTGETLDQDRIDNWAASLEEDIVSGLITCGCGGSGALTRITEDGVLEVSYDGGETWTPAPELDPRKTSTIFPPLTHGEGDDVPCMTADNIVQWATDWIDQVADVIEAGGALLTVAGVIGELAVLYLSGGSLAGLIVPLAGATIALGGSALRAAFDSGVYDAFRCCVDCAVSGDGTLTSAGMSELLDCIGSEVTGSAAIVLSAMVQVMGEVGMTNVGRTGSGTGEDCDDCDCNDFCVTFDDPDLYELLSYSGYYGFGTIGMSTLNGSDGNPAPCANSAQGLDGSGIFGYSCVVKIPLPVRGTVLGIAFDYKYHREDTPITAVRVDYWNDGDTSPVATATDPGTGATDTWNTGGFAGSGVDCDYIVVTNGGSGVGVGGTCYGRIDNICVNM